MPTASFAAQRDAFHVNTTIHTIFVEPHYHLISATERRALQDNVPLARAVLCVP
eukprot:COSAG01_NODE_22345_length_859_cov_4.200000_1_plen_53_part_10